jgi:ubiquinone/menaquinone biosynthesis C-methylase UbiE
MLNKLARPLVRKIRDAAKKVREWHLGYDGDFYYGAKAAEYEQERSQHEWWHVEHRIVGELLAELPKGLSVLDVPLGTGRFLPIYANRQMKVTGLEISHEMIATARRLHAEHATNCRMDIGNAKKLPYEDNTFDLVLSFRFLDGIIVFRDQKKVLKELVRVTKKYLILEVYSIPDGDDSKMTIKNLKAKELVAGRLNHEERKKLLEQFGMKVIKKVPGAIELELRPVIYLCEKTISS